MVPIGLTYSKEIIVTNELTASNYGSGLVPVYATPAMIGLMENTCMSSVLSYLDEGQGTVGTAVNIKHLAATPVGMKVICKSELIEANGRALKFKVQAWDECDLIGEGIHERFIIYPEKFMKKNEAKRNKNK